MCLSVLLVEKESFFGWTLRFISCGIAPFLFDHYRMNSDVLAKVNLDWLTSPVQLLEELGMGRTSLAKQEVLQSQAHHHQGFRLDLVNQSLMPSIQ